MKRYQLKKEFFPMLGISEKQWERRKKDLLEWLKNFYDYEIIEGLPIYIEIKEQYGDYQPLPRKSCNQSKLNAEKNEAYSKFTIAALGTEFKPNSKMRVAREAIDSFGYEKFSHTNAKFIATKFVKPSFDKYGETNNKNVWVYYSTYLPFPEEVVEDWRTILREEHISEEEAANAFYRSEQGEDISQEKQYFKRARERFIEKYGEFPVLVKEWKCKN